MNQHTLAESSSFLTISSCFFFIKKASTNGRFEKILEALKKTVRMILVRGVRPNWFWFYADGDSNKLLPANQTKLYTEDWIGLKTLDDAGKVKFVSVDGEHIRMAEPDVIKYVVPYLKNQPVFYTKKTQPQDQGALTSLKAANTEKAK